GDARPRPDATGHRPARRQGGGARPAALLGALRTGPALRRAGAVGLAGAAAARGSVKPYCYVPVTHTEEGIVAHTLYLFLAGGTDVHTPADEGVAIQGEEYRLVFRQLPAGLRTALQRLAGAGADEDTLIGIVSASDGSTGLMRWYYYLQQLEGRGLLR